MHFLKFRYSSGKIAQRKRTPAIESQRHHFRYLEPMQKARDVYIDSCDLNVVLL